MRDETSPPIPADEPFRLEDLHALRVLDTSKDPNFERIVTLATQIFDVPIALVSLVDSDRQWFKAKVGLDATETQRDIAFCARAILDSSPLIVEDATKDARFADNPLVTGRPHIRFYAGAPLIAGSGRRLGTLCVVDRKPRTMTPQQVATLRTLAAVTVQALYAHKQALETKALFEAATSNADRTSGIYATLGQALRTPLSHIVGFSQLLEIEGFDSLTKARFEEYLRTIVQSAEVVVDLFNRIDRLENGANRIGSNTTLIDITATLQKIVHCFDPMARAKKQQIVFRHDDSLTMALMDDFSLRQIANNLISNVIDHSPEHTTIKVIVSNVAETGSVRIEIRDQGPGIPDDVLKRLDDPLVACPAAATERQIEGFC